VNDKKTNNPNFLWKAAQATLLRPPYVRHCCQTIYMSLSGCINLWDATHDEQWHIRASSLCSLLQKIQRPDGGFDPGYDYNFGKLHRKGESISSEIFGLSVLMRYYVRFGGSDVKTSIHRATNWIKQFSTQINEEMWAIPYGPYSSKKIMVYNGTSFVAGALGEYLSIFPDKKLELIYHGMLTYLSNVMSESSDIPGKFWYYSDQSRTDLSKVARNKIDYYHQMQQVEIHSRAQLVLPNQNQLQLIKEATEHVLFLQKDDGLIPYLNTSKDIHLWGYCSCASGFFLAAKVLNKEAKRYHQAATKILDWIYSHSWNGNYFYPIVGMDGIPLDRNYYVRSDAWVFNAFSLSVLEGIQTEKYLEVCKKCFQSMERVNFSGIENHAGNLRILTTRKLLSFLVASKRKLSKK